MLSRLKSFFVGKPLNPFLPINRRHLTLIALFAWVGLGADALSSSCYGPEEAYIALGTHTHLALYISIITIFTIFIITIGYNQVIELFPSGAGGYKVATTLLHPYAGLISGCALVVDYVLTITISIASGVDALFSLLPVNFLGYKLMVEALLIIFLWAFNLRGFKETILIVFPIFLGFVIIHTLLILYGVFAHSHGLMKVVPMTLQQTHEVTRALGILPVMGLILHAYSLGSGTYTGLEAVSNNVQRLPEPRIYAAKRSMLLMAISLSFTAGGIILLYLLWHAKPVLGQTLNAVVFGDILGTSMTGHALLILTLVSEALLLGIAANTGFIDGPNVLASLAIDGWLPNRFRYLSKRLVVQNGILILGLGALGILYWTAGNVSLLAVLYSITVFITFTLSLLSISVYWIKHRAQSTWFGHFLLSTFACLITLTILCITIYYKFSDGAWLTLLITSSLVALCLVVKHHYSFVGRRLQVLDNLLRQPIDPEATMPLAIDPKLPTAILFVNNLSVGMHLLLTVLRLFSDQFKNVVFLSASAVDAANFNAHNELAAMRSKANDLLDYFVKFCQQEGIPAEGYAVFGTDSIAELEKLANQLNEKYPNAIFFASQLIFPHDNMFTRVLHNQTALLLQDYLNLHNKELIIMPMKI